MFCQTMDTYTYIFGYLVIHYSSKSNKLEDQVFWYKDDDYEENYEDIILDVEKENTNDK